jgi:hypothetical protein
MTMLPVRPLLKNARPASSVGSRWLFVIITSVQVAFAVVSTAVAQDRPPERRVRVIQQWLRPPLAARLLPDDDIVVVERMFPPYELNDVAQKMSRDEALRQAVNLSRSVIVVDVETVSGVLAEEDTWLWTRAHAVLRETVVAAPQLAAKKGSQVIVVEDGGEMTIDGKTVRTAPVVQPMRPGGRYLMFLLSPTDDGISYPLARFEVMEDGTLRDPILDRVATHYLHAITGAKLEDAKKRIARFAAEKARSASQSPKR